MRLTVSRYYTPSGHAIQADGVHPDVAVELKKADGSVSYREKDLEGHLAPEPGSAPALAPRGVMVLSTDAGAPTYEMAASTARNVPDDPEKGTDAVLRVGWEVLHRAMGGATPR